MVVDSVLEAARTKILADTNSDAYKELDLMSAPIDELFGANVQGDTIRWTAPSDSCVLLIRGNREMVGNVPRDNYTIVGEWFGSGGWAGSDIAPSPDWRYMAYGFVEPLKRPSDADSLESNSHVPRAEIVASAVRQPDGSSVVVVPVIERIYEGCSGDACDLEAASPTLGGWRVGWSARGDALVAGRENPPHWIALDPETRKPVDHKPEGPIPVRWVVRSAAQILAKHDTVRSPSGVYAFVSRNDSLWVSGPDRNGRATVRYVGSGVPVASTRNGQYLLAVRKTSGRAQRGVYVFRLYHAMMHSSCDR